MYSEMERTVLTRKAEQMRIRNESNINNLVNKKTLKINKRKRKEPRLLKVITKKNQQNYKK
jgi:hypothetical protein